MIVAILVPLCFIVIIFIIVYYNCFKSNDPIDENETTVELNKVIIDLKNVTPHKSWPVDFQAQNLPIESIKEHAEKNQIENSNMLIERMENFENYSPEGY